VTQTASGTAERRCEALSGSRWRQALRARHLASSVVCARRPSDAAEHLEQRGHRVHAVEKVQRNGKIENCGPYAEAKCLLFQAVVVLRAAAEGREDPQLKERKKLN